MNRGCDCDSIRLYVLRFDEDSPKHSTALKLERLGLADRISTRSFFRRKTVLLDPFAEKVLTLEDCGVDSIIVVDRSWKKLADDRRIPSPRGRIIRRRLPLAKASNPVNYARAGILSSAEALALSLLVLCCFDRAIQVLSKFKWGHVFFELNRELVNELKSRCSNG